MDSRLGFFTGIFGPARASRIEWSLDDSLVREAMTKGKIAEYS